MLAFLIYTVGLIAVTSFAQSTLITTIALGIYLYISYVFTESEAVAIWYGIPVEYDAGCHYMISIFGYPISFPRLTIVKGLRSL